MDPALQMDSALVITASQVRAAQLSCIAQEQQSAVTMAHANRMALAIACQATLVLIVLLELQFAPWAAQVMGNATLILSAYAMMAGLVMDATTKSNRWQNDVL
jgi:hypothetical protein